MNKIKVVKGSGYAGKSEICNFKKGDQRSPRS